MHTSFQPKLEGAPKKEDLELLGAGIDENNIRVTGETTGDQDITFFIRNAENTIIGGIRGRYNNSGWLYILSIWIDRENRNNGYGTSLMQRLEKIAKGNGCTQCYLHAISFQAPEFYKKQGYTVFAELENFHQEYSKLFLRKKI